MFINRLFFCCLLSVFTVGGIVAQSAPVPPSGEYPSLTDSSRLAVLTRLGEQETFVLREIAGIFTVRDTSSVKTVCYWQDDATGELYGKVASGYPGECTVFSFGSRIGIGIIDDNGKLLKDAAINAWRKLPYLRRE